MKYIEDCNFKYKDDLIKCLREYNIKHTGHREKSNEYYYALKDGEVQAGFQVNYAWDWVGFSGLYYKTLESLKGLMSEVSIRYQDKAVGLKYYTPEEGQLKDFISIGFQLAGTTVKTPMTDSYFYLRHTDFQIESPCYLDIVVSQEKIPNYEAIFTESRKTLKNKDQIHQVQESNMMFVALDQDHFVGGVYGSINRDSMYIAWLAVDENYRHQGIGLELMKRIEERAKALKVYSINLGTVEFQAKDFYQKLGYKPILKKENDPKGFNSYTMLKKL